MKRKRLRSKPKMMMLLPTLIPAMAGCGSPSASLVLVPVGKFVVEMVLGLLAEERETKVAC